MALRCGGATKGGSRLDVTAEATSGPGSRCRFDLTSAGNVRGGMVRCASSAGPAEVDQQPLPCMAGRTLRRSAKASAWRVPRRLHHTLEAIAMDQAHASVDNARDQYTWPEPPGTRRSVGTDGRVHKGSSGAYRRPARQYRRPVRQWRTVHRRRPAAENDAWQPEVDGERGVGRVERRHPQDAARSDPGGDDGDEEYEPIRGRAGASGPHSRRRRNVGVKCRRWPRARPALARRPSWAIARDLRDAAMS